MTLVLLFLLLPVALAAQDTAWLALHNAGAEALTKGRYADGRASLVAAWEQAKHFDATDERRGLSAYSLATACQLEGDFSQADILFTEAVAVFESSGPAAHNGLALAVDALGDLRFEQGHFADAERLYTRGLALNRETRGEADVLTALSYRHLAVIYAVLNKPLESEEAFKTSIRIFRDNGTSSKGLASALEGLGRLYLSQKRHDEAERLMRESLECTRDLPDGDPVRADARLNLGMVYRMKGDLARAEPLLRKALASYERTGDSHKSSALSELAGLAVDEKKFKTAERYMAEALQGMLEHYGPDHPAVATAQYWMAGVYASEGKFALAEALVRKSLVIERNTYGENHPEIAKSLTLLAAIEAKSRHTIEVGEQASFHRRASGATK